MIFFKRTLFLIIWNLIAQILSQSLFVVKLLKGMHSLRIVAVLMILFFNNACNSENHEQGESFEILEIKAERSIGIIDFVVEMKIKEIKKNILFEIECSHRDTVNDWFLEFKKMEDGGDLNELPLDLIVKVSLFVNNKLKSDFVNDEIGGVVLYISGMPDMFSQLVYRDISAEMMLLNGGPVYFDDEKIDIIIEKAFEKNESVKIIKKNFEEEGFDVILNIGEVYVIRRELQEKSWKEIASDPKSGFNDDSFRIWFKLKRMN